MEKKVSQTIQEKLFSLEKKLKKECESKEAIDNIKNFFNILKNPTKK